MFISLGFTGCNKATDNSSVIPTISESLLAIEIPEPEPIEEPEDTTGANGSQGSIEDINESEFVEGTTLTQEELDELLATFTTDRAKEGVEAYEAIMNNESYTLSAGITVTKVVGKPGDTSWCKMTKEEAQAALDADPGDLIAYGELHAGEYNAAYGETIYYNPYDYANAVHQGHEDEKDHLLSYDAKPFELVNPEVARRGYKESGYTDEEIDKIFAEIQAEYDQKVNQQ
jgi:hypothetical protein